MYTDDQEYVTMRLQNTVVRDKKLEILVNIFHVGEGEDGLWALVCKIGGEEVDRYNLSLSDLELSSPPLGNIDYNGHTYFVSRMPKRNDWRQGLRRDNLVYVQDGRLYNYNFDSLKMLNAPVYNRYKPYKKGRAFSRNFSVDKEGALWYKCREIVGQDVDGVPVLSVKYEWLKEALEDALNR